MGNFLNVNDIGSLKSQVTPAVILDASGNIVDFGSIIAASGDVIGPSSSVDNQVVRFDGTSGKVIQGGNLIISDTGTVTPTVSGVSNIGSTSLYFNTGYFNTIVAGTIASSGNDGNYVNVTGDSMTGDLTMASPAAINASYISGNTDIHVRTTGLYIIDIIADAVVQGSSLLISGTAATMTHSNPIGNAVLDLSVSAATLSKAGLAGTSSLSTTLGQVQMAGSGLWPVLSGNSNLGSKDLIYSNVVAQTGTFGTITGLSPIGVASDLVPSASGTVNLGSASNYFGTIYANSVIQTGSSSSPGAASGISAWGNIWYNSGGTPAISGSYNVASITDKGVGWLGVTYTSAVPAGAAAVTSFMLNQADASPASCNISMAATPSGSTTAGCQIRTAVAGFGVYDFANIYFAIVS